VRTQTTANKQRQVVCEDTNNGKVVCEDTNNGDGEQTTAEILFCVQFENRAFF
jgi:hypothetical protein